MANEVEIGRFKNKGNEIFDISGTIPEGQIKFVNQTENTSGTESFRNGTWHGWYKEYYDNGRIKRETRYSYGKKIENKEYFNQYSNQHYHNNKQYYRDYNNNRNHTDIEHYIKKVIGIRINMALKSYNKSKQDSHNW